MKIALESFHQLLEVVDTEDISEVFVGNPNTSDDIITVVMRNGERKFCDCLNFDYNDGDYKDGFR